MLAYHAFRKAAIRYWERRRIIYNLALVPAAFLGYAIADTFNWIGDAHKTHYGFVVFWLAMSAFGANICYSFAYALEFIFGGDRLTSRWLRFGRTSVFVAGVLLAMLLAFIGGRNIAKMEYYEGINDVG
jgi:Mn2+/Fe2+ NRAMP family transporter